jgi:hypothetical protein
LALHLGRFLDYKTSFLSTHGGNGKSFAKANVSNHVYHQDRVNTSQGLTHTFVFCENRMWRLGARQIPNSIVRRDMVLAVVMVVMVVMVLAVVMVVMVVMVVVRRNMVHAVVMVVVRRIWCLLW